MLASIDGLLDVVVFRDSSVLRVLIHLVFVAGGRPLPPRAHGNPARTVGADCAGLGRPLPVHADGDPVGVTPASFDVEPGVLRVIVGPPDGTGIRAWEVVGPVGG